LALARVGTPQTGHRQLQIIQLVQVSCCKLVMTLQNVEIFTVFSGADFVGKFKIGLRLV
jgi:hypothetical protein